MATQQNQFEVDEHGRTELMRRAAEGDLSAVKSIVFSQQGTGIFCQRFALIRKEDGNGQTAITIARNAGHDEVAEFLRREHDHMWWYE